MSDVLYFTDKIPKYSFLLNTYETKFMIDDYIFYHILGYIYYKQYIDDGNVAAAQHILSQESPLYCKMYRRRNPIKKRTLETWSVEYTSKILERVVFHKFLSNITLATKLIDIPQNAILYINNDDTLLGCTSDHEGHNILGRSLTITKHIISTTNIFRVMRCDNRDNKAKNNISSTHNSDKNYNRTE